MNTQSTQDGAYEATGARHWSQIGQVHPLMQNRQPWWLRLVVVVWYVMVAIGCIYLKNWLQGLVAEVLK